jgi:hypothetical protein
VIEDGTTTDSIYWATTIGGAPGTPSGTVTPSSGGPITPGTTIVLTYIPTAPGPGGVAILYSLQPVLDTHIVPSDGGRLPFYIPAQ